MIDNLVYYAYLLIIGPIELLMNVIFSGAFLCLKSVIGAVVILSIAVNALTLPLYSLAERKQSEYLRRKRKSNVWLEHINKNFRSDERVMIRQAYFRESRQHPWDFLHGMLPIFLELPFFVAAYHFLSDLSLFDGASYWMITDFDKPDAMISIGMWAVNVLPIVMTAINILSALIYDAGNGSGAKKQMIITALVFMVLLYNSPSGIVFYWICNNVFSLAKNVVYRIKRSKDCVGGGENEYSGRKDVYFKSFFLIMLSIATIIGVMIPSILISSSPFEFIDRSNATDPALYIIFSFLLSIGTFVLWGNVIYCLVDVNGKKMLTWGAFYILLTGIFTYVFFARRPGSLFPNLIYDNFFISDEERINGAVICITWLFVFYFFYKMIVPRLGKKVIASCRKGLAVLFVAVIFSAVAIGVVNILKINSAWEEYKVFSQNDENDRLVGLALEDIVLSTKENNVMVIMLDGAVGVYIPYFIQEKPELMDIYEGFTYYPNTISHGLHTIYGAAELFGGYEYTPEAMNDRGDMLISEKYDEALKVMPVLFSESGMTVYVYDMPIAGYRAVSDMSIYDSYPLIHAGYISKRNISAVDSVQMMEDVDQTLYLWSFSKMLPLFFQEPFYCDGTYMLAKRCFPYTGGEALEYIAESGKLPELISNGNVMPKESANQLINVSSMLVASEDAPAAFVSFDNEITHNMAVVDEPEYVIVDYADNSVYDEEHADRFFLPDGTGIEHADANWYKTNMAAIVALGEVFERMKEIGVYDNTRIIIVSDHGSGHRDSERMVFRYGENEFDTEWAYPLLMVKEVGDKGFKTDDSFMTIADVPSIAIEGMMDNRTNPFTGKIIDSSPKKEKQLVYDCYVHNPYDYIGKYKYATGTWYSVRYDRRNMENWEFLGTW